MRLRICLGDKSLTAELERNYNHLLQSAIYTSLPGPVSSFFHDHGYPYEKRTFKMMTFSRLLGCCVREGNTLRFRGPIRLVVCSPSECFCNSLATSLLRLGVLRIGKAEMPVSTVAVEAIPADQDSVVVRTLSPVVAYSTLLRREGSKYTCYFAPGDPEFERIAAENAVKKLIAFRRVDQSNIASMRQLRISVMGSPKMAISYFKGTLIKAYDARLDIKGDPLLINVVLEAGLGSKNAQGFGCLEPTHKSA